MCKLHYWSTVCKLFGEVDSGMCGYHLANVHFLAFFSEASSLIHVTGIIGAHVVFH